MTIIEKHKHQYYEHLSTMQGVDNDSVFKYIQDLESKHEELLNLIKKLTQENDALSAYCQEYQKIILDNLNKLNSIKDFHGHRRKGKAFTHYDKVAAIKLLHHQGSSFTDIGFSLGIDYQVVSKIIYRKYSAEVNKNIDKIWDITVIE